MTPFRLSWFRSLIFRASLLGLATLPSLALAETAEYTVVFDATWSAATHPQGFPAGPHFSRPIGGLHNATVSFWQSGGLASPGMESMAELGGISLLAQEVQDAIAAGGANLVTGGGGGIGLSPGSVTLPPLVISREFPLVTLVSMLAPSPDWFVGVSGLSLLENGVWVDEKVVTLHVYDAGTDSGSDYTSSDRNTFPQEPISRLESGPFASGVPVGTFTFTRTDAPSTAPLALADGRFEVTARWRDFDGGDGLGVPVGLTADTGYFWFFDAGNVEVVIKVLDGCSINGRFWVFAGGLTNVEVELRVEDTQTGQVNTYANVLGQAFEPIQDTDAFATCP